ncbi:hypothetical protein M951_chr3163 (nucleomorph) [Lotharella oceanica]|uniref:Uncharacterized protein n=1 Tax=Lotharella oceanica TaxID=641309 RepID=A0A060D7E3_9EUKA|nr:hypothetical protein M951_chr142 [Lotharella oceanica]AIB09668.1 hypothetical protein M951_chr1189 [Lotharella oceanica]AIB09745.1 hypothetical protein M951_chr242 [Lotharella oceanica]AIB09871.1 hypothetical protein M951_chr2179 [Lotharella oceanica]AIB09948.1 hypothetical protein M951_chr342 [Lotharella oceanica]
MLLRNNSNSSKGHNMTGVEYDYHAAAAGHYSRSMNNRVDWLYSKENVRADVLLPPPPPPKVRDLRPQPQQGPLVAPFRPLRVAASFERAREPQRRGEAFEAAKQGSKDP